MSNLIGRRIGAYVIQSQIGSGSHSEVYLALDTANDNRRVALKVLRLEHNTDQDKVKRFWDGGNAARVVDHEHVVPIYDAGLADGHYYIAMAYMGGRSIDDLLQQSGPIAPEHAIRYLEQIASAIDHGHRRGIIHRDIKPSNILLSADRRDAFLADYGVAKLTGRKTQTEFGAIIGTPEYMSPEQVLGHKVTARSDIYSLGVTAYHMLTGRLPFDGHAAAVLYNHVNTAPPPVRAADNRVSAALNRPIAKAMSKQPNRRHATATDFVKELQRAVGVRTPPPQGRKQKGAPPPGAPGRAPLSPMKTALALLAVLAVLAVAYFALGGGGPRVVVVDVTATPGVRATGGGGGPTSTAAPTARATSTTRPTAAPSRTAGAAQPVTRSPAVTLVAGALTPSAATPTPTPLVSGELRLLSPADGADIPADRGRGQLFSWQFNRAPAADESFELRFYPAGGGPFLAPFGWRKESAAGDIDLSNLPPGDYRWVVAVVRGTDGQWEEDVTISPSFTLRWGR